MEWNIRGEQGALFSFSFSSFFDKKGPQGLAPLQWYGFIGAYLFPLKFPRVKKFFIHSCL
jgi:hypothetical protein